MTATDPYHIINDLEIERTRLLRKQQAAKKLLIDGLHALRHDSQHITDDYIERVIDSFDD